MEQEMGHQRQDDAARSARDGRRIGDRAGRGERVSERRCVITGDCSAPASLVRFVIGPDGAPVPDIAESLPGRGFWISARAALWRDRRAARRAARWFKGPDQLANAVPLVEALLARRCMETIGFARRAGQAIGGFDRVRVAVASGKPWIPAILIRAQDAGPTSADKSRSLARGKQFVDLLTRSELGVAFGRESWLYAAVAPGGLGERLARDVSRLAGFREPDTIDQEAGASESGSRTDPEIVDLVRKI